MLDWRNNFAAALKTVDFSKIAELPGLNLQASSKFDDYIPWPAEVLSRSYDGFDRLLKLNLQLRYIFERASLYLFKLK